jgi:hypothetical protein
LAFIVLTPGSKAGTERLKGIKVVLVLDKDGGFELYYNIQYGIIWFIL